MSSYEIIEIKMDECDFNVFQFKSSAKIALKIMLIMQHKSQSIQLFNASEKFIAFKRNAAQNTYLLIINSLGKSMLLLTIKTNVHKFVDNNFQTNLHLTSFMKIVK